MVSVIIPNFNHALFLNQRIDSVLQQTYQDFELIILDDCSTDNSKEVIEQYRKQPKISCIVYNEVNSGSTFKQWEKGIELAKGDFVWIAESDDWAELTFLEELVLQLENHPNVGLVYCDSSVYKGAEKVNTFSQMNNSLMEMKKWSNDYNIEGVEELKTLYSVCTINNASAVLFRKAALEKVFPFDNYFRFMGDWFTYLNIANNYRIAYLATALNNYRYHESNVSKQVSKELSFVRERFIISNYILTHCKSLDKQEVINSFFDYSVHKVDFKKNTLTLYKELIKINSELLFVLIKYNIIVKKKQQLKKLLKVT